MRVLGIGGSPRRGGNTDILLDCALKAAKAEGAVVTKVILNNLKISPCQECGGCDKMGVCIIRDDMRGLYEKLAEAEVIIIASPIFFGSLSAQTKIMIDRCQSLWITKYILKKNIVSKKKRKGAFIAAGAAKRKDFFENARSIIKNFFATIDVSYTNELFCPVLIKKGWC